MEVVEDKNFGLSSTEFNQMIADLREQDYTLFERVFLTQFDESLRYVRRKYSSSYEDAYDATMDALIDLRSRMVQGKIAYGNLRYLFTTMASQHFLKNVKKFRITELSETDMITTKDPYGEEELSMLHIAFQALGDQCRDLLQLHFYEHVKLKDISESMGKTTVAIRKQKERCVKKLIEIFNSNSENLAS